MQSGDDSSIQTQEAIGNDHLQNEQESSGSSSHEESSDTEGVSQGKDNGDDEREGMCIICLEAEQDAVLGCGHYADADVRFADAKSNASGGSTRHGTRMLTRR